MENKPIYKNIEQDMNFKLNLCYSSSLYQPVEIEKINKDNKEINIDPIFVLLENWEEIEKFLNKPYYLPFFYLNRAKVDSILYNNETEITINSIKSDDKLYFSSHLYLALLIEDNINVINYIYPIELIKVLNEMKSKEDKKDNIKIIIMAKILNILAVNFENSDNYDDSDLSKYKDHKDIINDNEKLLKEYQLNKEDVLTKKIDEIYSSIITQLIIKDQLKESENTYKIIKSLDLENFYITKSIFDELKNVFSTEKDYIKKYEINKYEDIFDDDILSFYYILFKYILKNPLYVYQIPFLLKTRKNILKCIKKNIEKLNSTLKDNRRNKNKIEFVLNYFITFDYYCKCSLKIINERSFNSYSNLGNNISNQNYINDSVVNSGSVSGYFNSPSLNSEKDKIGKSLGQIDEQNISEYAVTKKRCEKEVCFHILDQSTFSFHTNRKGSKESKTSITFEEISVSHQDYQNKKFTIDEIKKLTAKDETLKESYKKFLSVLESIINRIKNEFSLQYKLKIILKFRIIDIQNSKYIIKCTSVAKIPGEKDSEYSDENILENGLTFGFPYLLNEINNEVYNDLSYKD